MTKADRERAIKKLRYMIGEASAYCGECKSMDEGANEEIEALNMGIEALLQEPCEDAVSRQALIDLAEKGVLVSNGNLKSVTKAINGLPSVIPIRPKGAWVGIDEEPHETWECNHCGFVIDCSGCDVPTEHRDAFKFCPNCGLDMRGEKE